MGGSQKSKRVAWASDVNLCQVKLFLSEESPSQVGLGTQDHLQAKISWPSKSGGMGLDDNLPPGFEEIQTANLWTVKLSQIPLVRWRCPPRFEVDSVWAVVTGEESIEMEVENQREMRVLEAIYPRPSAIPPNPSALVGVENSSIKNQNPPLIPITAIEDEDNSSDATFISMAVNSSPIISHPQHLSHGTFSPHAITTNEILTNGVESDIVAAAQAALTSIMPKSDQGSLIDQELLLKILSNPKMVEQLLTNHNTSSSANNTSLSNTSNIPTSNLSMPITGGKTSASSSKQQILLSHVPNVTPSSFQSMPATGVHNFTPSMHNVPSTSMQLMPNSRLPPKNSYDSVNIATNRRDSLPTHLSRPELVAPLMTTASLPFNPPLRNQRPSEPDMIPAPSPAVPVVKDINYFKSLIQQHGEERRENLSQFVHQSSQPSGTSQETLNIAKSRDSKQKIMKPCIFFNSPRGCRNGTNCSYQHDSNPQQNVGVIPEVQSAKRMKVNREITGT